MSHSVDAAVAAILENLTLGSALEAEVGATHLETAVRDIRIAAFDHRFSITKEQQRRLDAAIRGAYARLSNGDAEPYDDQREFSFRLMIGALHVVIADWARQERQPLGTGANVVVEAYAMVRMLENSLNDRNIISALGRRRSRLPADELTALRTIVDGYYREPPMRQSEPAGVEGILH